MNFSDRQDVKDKARELKCVERAKAFLRRGLGAGIPKRYLPVKEDDFASILSPSYDSHKEVDDFASFIYHNPLELLETPFIVIDGGDIDSRKKAGFAILFRLILCDRFGMYNECGRLADRLQSLSFKENRSDIIADLKTIGCLFISEFDYNQFQPYVNAGGLLDELIGSRVDNVKPTIISFSSPLQSSNMQTDKHCGEYLTNLSSKEYPMVKDKTLNPFKGVLRIRVKVDQ